MVKKLAISIAAAVLSLNALIVCAEAADQKPSKEQEAFKIFQCVKPDITSYWKGEGSGGQDDFVIVYSMQGFIADIETRLPANIVQAIRDASAQALSKDQITLAARDMGPLSGDFYAALQSGLSKLAKLPEDACGTQVQRLITIFNARYHFSMQGSQMDSWYITNHINELNVKNDEFVALFSKGSEIKGSCKVVFDDEQRRVSVCK